jgi:hypothetical protein
VRARFARRTLLSIALLLLRPAPEVIPVTLSVNICALTSDKCTTAMRMGV